MAAHEVRFGAPVRPQLPKISMQVHPTKKHFFAATVLLALATTLTAQRQRIETRSYEFEAAGKDMEYALFVPKKYDKKQPAPLVVLLHGLGSNPRQVMGYQGIALPLWS